MTARLARTAGAFAAAVAIAATLGSALSTLWVAGALADIGAPLPAALTARMAATDIAGMGPAYAAFVAIAFLIAFLAAAGTARLTGLPRILVCAVAGGVAVAVMLAMMKPVFFGTQPIAGARTGLGLAAQAFAGVLAGAAFAVLTSRSAGEISA